MVIENYSLPCKYRRGGLKNELYFQKFEDNIKYTIDEKYLPICHEIYGSLSSITCNSLSLKEDTTFNNKFEFTYNLTVTIDEIIDDTFLEIINYLLKNKLRLYVQTTDGLFYLINAEYPYTMNYNYEWSNSKHGVTITFTCQQNVPTMKCEQNIKEISTDITPSICQYHLTDIEEFDIIEKPYLFVKHTNNNELKYDGLTIIEGESWKHIRPLKDTFKYNHILSGGSYQDTIEFQIELSDYLTSFHYNILEFTENKYIVKFNTSNNNNILVGEEYGLFPSFNLSTSEDSSNLNTVTIRLSQTSNKEICFADDPFENTNVVKKKSSTSNSRRQYSTYKTDISNITYPTVECISPTMAKRLILSEIGLDGKETGYYYVLSGYEPFYKDIAHLIKGTFTEETINRFEVSQYVFTPMCMNTDAIFYTEITDNITIENGSCSSFKIVANKDWSVNPNHDECLTISPTSGKAFEEYEITICSECDCDSSNTFEIVIGNTTTPYTITTTCEDKWINDEEEFICEGNDKYYKKYKWVKDTETGEYVKTDEFQIGELIEKYSEYCGYVPYVDYIWVLEDDGMCEFDLPQENIPQIIDPYGTISTIGETVYRFDYLEEYKINIEGEIGRYAVPHNVMRVDIGNNVTSIGGGAFAGLPFLELVTIPDSVTSIGASAFANCTSLTSIGYKGSGSSLEIPDNITEIKDGTFQGCSSLTSVIIPDSVTSIGYLAFYGCRSISSLTIGSGVEILPNDTFHYGNSNALKTLILKNDNINIQTNIWLKNGVVYFNGTQEKFVQLSSTWRYVSIDNSKIYCSNGTIENFNIHK